MGEKPNTSEVACIDIRSCRPNSLFSYGYGLPVFSPIDDPQPCIDDSGALLYSLQYFDYYLVDASAKYDIKKAEVLDSCRPYYGRKLYDLRTVQYMLDETIIYTTDLVFGLKATTRFPLKAFEEAFEKLKSLMGETVEQFEDWLTEHHATDAVRAHEKGKSFDIKAYYEKAIGLQLLGLLGKDPGHIWTTVRSKTEDDAPGEIHSITRVPGEEVPYLNVRTKLLDMQSTKPWKLIVLNGEQINLREMRKCLLNICPVPITMHGERVDCIYFSTKNPFDTLLGISGQLPEKFKMTTEHSYLVPNNAKSAVGENVTLARFETAEWLKVFESDKTSIRSAAEKFEVQCCSPSCLHWDNCDYVYNTFARLIVSNNGGYISGAAGVGKTTLIKQIKERILEVYPSAHIISMALTHVAARLAQGAPLVMPCASLPRSAMPGSSSTSVHRYH